MTHLSEEGYGDACAEELAHVLPGELAEEVKDVLLDRDALLFGIGGIVGDGG